MKTAKESGPIQMAFSFNADDHYIPASLESPGIGWGLPSVSSTALEPQLNETSKICKIEGCDRIRKYKNWCHFHYQRWRKNGDPLVTYIKKQKPPKVCSIDGCDKPANKSGLCRIHQSRWRKYGDPLIESAPKINKRISICNIHDCDKSVHSHGLCQHHVYKLRKYGNPLAIGVTEIKKKCAVSECEYPHSAHGYCDMHYRRMKVHGDPLWPSCKAQDCRFLSRADMDGYCRVHYENLILSGDPLTAMHLEVNGYIKLNVPDHPNADVTGKIYQHVYVMSQIIGRALHKGETVHHKNGVRSDNHPENLELWSRSHGAGQRVTDRIAWAVELLEHYAHDRSLWPKDIDPLEWRPGKPQEFPRSD